MQVVVCFEPCWCYGISVIILPVSSSHIFTRPPMPPDAIHRPSGEIDKSLTTSVCWENVNTAYVLLALVSHILTFVSALDVAIMLCYSSWAMLVIVVLWPVNMVGCCDPRFQIYMAPPSVPANKCSALLSNPMAHTLLVWFERVSFGLVLVIFHNLMFF